MPIRDILPGIVPNITVYPILKQRNIVYIFQSHGCYNALVISMKENIGIRYK